MEIYILQGQIDLASPEQNSSTTSDKLIMSIMVPPEEQGKGRRCCVCIIFVAFLLGLTAIMVLVSIFASKELQYYAAIDAVSGLDPATNNLSKPAADQVEFDLTLGVKSRSPFSSECLEPGANVSVIYPGVEIAGGRTQGQACAAGWRPEQMVRLPVVARGNVSRLPDSLAADVRRRGAAALFDVLLRIPATPGDDAKLVMCRDRRVGGAAEALSSPCEVLKSS